MLQQRQQQRQLRSKRAIRKGAEADIYLAEWHGRPAVSKVRTPKAYRHESLDSAIRKHRTIHEASFISAAKMAGVSSPFVYFVDPVQAEIVMEFVEGRSAKDALSPRICREIGATAAMLHAHNIIHGDLTTSNFIVTGGRNGEGKGARLVLLDFGLAYYSERTEDMATDVRLIKEVFSSAHVAVADAFPSFVQGYAGVAGRKKTERMLENVREIEQRGRYARVS